MSAPSQAAQSAQSAQAAPAQPQQQEIPVPSVQALIQASKLAQQLDRPIQLDYYADSRNNKAVIGQDEDTEEKLLVKSKEEYTSIIQKIYKVDTDYIILTENSLYIVSTQIAKRKIKASSLLGNEM